MAEGDNIALRADKLAIRRGARELFHDLSFVVRAGEYVEVRGANGAGKTSLLRALAGFLKPSAGQIHFDAAEEPALALHYLGHLNGLKGSASVSAHLRYWSGLFGVSSSLEQSAARLGLMALRDLPARVLSQGQQRRLALARLLIAPRPIWLLDEPAASLDGAGRTLIGELVDSHRQRGGLAIAAVHEPLGPTAHASVILA